MAFYVGENKSCSCFREKCDYTCKFYAGMHKSKITNADRIRSMSDEEFSYFLFGIQCAPASRPKEWLEWMKQEAEDG